MNDFQCRREGGNYQNIVAEDEQSAAETFASDIYWDGDQFEELVVYVDNNGEEKRFVVRPEQETVLNAYEEF